MPFKIIRQDITKLKVDAIVNAANPDLRRGGGVCGAIFAAAGARQLQMACDQLTPIKTGEVAVTPGYDLPAKLIIHAVGPVYRVEEKEQCRKLLEAAYRNSLEAAIAQDCESIAFPLISSGIYGYPKEESLHVATDAIRTFLEDHELKVYLTVFDRAAFRVSQKLLGAVQSFIDENYVKNHDRTAAQSFRTEMPVMRESLPSEDSLDAHFAEMDEPFSQTLFGMIDAKGKTDTEVYKKANIDRKLFSKIRSCKNYLPSKKTVLALAIGLELNLDETDQLLKQAGFALSHAVKFDVIVEYFIIQQKYDIFQINEVLFAYDQPLLGGK